MSGMLPFSAVGSVRQARRPGTLSRAHPSDLVGEVCIRCHVFDSEWAVGRVVEQTLIESVGEEANRWAAVNQREGQQTANVKVQVLPKS